MLRHTYELTRRLGSDSLHTTWEALQRPFSRRVHVRFFDKFEALGLSREAESRLRRCIASGGEGDWALDHGELETGSPFLVMRPPPLPSALQWWQEPHRSPGELAAFGLAVIKTIESLSAPVRAELVLSRLYVRTSGPGSLEIMAYAIGDRPTRAEVREMSGLVQRDLVLGFPPECFVPATADEVHLETRPAADTYRLAAVLYELLTGAHPIFPAELDVAGAVAELVNDIGRRPGPVAAGSAVLDDLVARGLSLDPGERPTLAELTTRLRAVAREERGERTWSSEEAAFGPSPTSTPKPSQLPRVFRWTVRLLVLAAIVLGTYLLANPPPRSASVVITSEPPGVQFEWVKADGEVEALGRTPILIEDVALDQSLSIRPIYEDGQTGEIHTVTPDRLEAFEACRGLRIRFEPRP